MYLLLTSKNNGVLRNLNIDICSWFFFLHRHNKWHHRTIFVIKFCISWSLFYHLNQWLFLCLLLLFRFRQSNITRHPNLLTFFWLSWNIWNLYFIQLLWFVQLFLLCHKFLFYFLKSHFIVLWWQHIIRHYHRLISLTVFVLTLAH